MVKVDTLSRRADHHQGKDDNSDIILLKSEHFRQHVFDLIGPESDIIEKIIRFKANKDNAVVKALANKDVDWIEYENGIVTWKNRVYVPRDKALREKIIKLHHDL